MNIRTIMAAYLPIPLFLADMLYAHLLDDRVYIGGLWRTVTGDLGLLKWAAVAITCVLIAKVNGRSMILRERLVIIMGGWTAAVLMFAVFLPLVDPGSRLSVQNALLAGGEGVVLFTGLVLLLGRMRARGLTGYLLLRK